MAWARRALAGRAAEDGRVEYNLCGGGLGRGERRTGEDAEGSSSRVQHGLCGVGEASARASCS